MYDHNYYSTREFIYTSESVGPGHPDKAADQVSDAILDAYLKQNPYARVAAETLLCPNRVVVAGEIKDAEIPPKEIEKIVRQTLRNIGYEQEGFHWDKVKIEVLLNKQSADIAMGVDNADKRKEGAGDQGIMFGYACDETDMLMPAPIYYSHRILQAIDEAVKRKQIPKLGPDAKSQVSLVYRGNIPLRAHSVVVSIQHPENLKQKEVREAIRPIVERTLPEGWMCEEEEFYVNPTGKFVIGGPVADVGVTGRKIIVDTYGGAVPHGGGAFSGKDPSKVDRSAAYMARYMAKNVVAAGLAKGCTLQVAYAIGVAKPLALYVNLHGTSTLREDEVADRLLQLIDLTPWGLREYLQLHKPIYSPTATYGHFGRTPGLKGEFSWEKIDLVEKLKKR